MKPAGPTLVQSRLPLPLLRRGKVREVYEVDADHLLIVASDRVSAFDVVMREPVPRKGAVLTQISAFWFEHLADVFPSHYVTARTAEIIERVPELAASGPSWRDERCWSDGRHPCRTSAWYEATSPARPGRNIGTVARWRVSGLPAGLLESDRLDPPTLLAGDEGRNRPRPQRPLCRGGRRSGACSPPVCGTRALRSIRPVETTPSAAV